MIHEAKQQQKVVLLPDIGHELCMCFQWYMVFNVSNNKELCVNELNPLPQENSRLSGLIKKKIRALIES